MSNAHQNKVVGSARGSAAHEDDEFWTEARRAAAKPIRLPKAPVVESVAPVVPKPDGPPAHTAHGHGTEKDVHEGKKALDSGGQAVASPLAYPYRTCGKLFFQQGGNSFSASASLVAPNILLTAGHCVYSGGWSTNVAFYPSYGKRASTDPFYKLNYSYIACWTAWSQNGNRAYDYGMVWIDSAPGNTIGWLGMLWNASTSGRTWDAVGYPATPNPPFNGNAMDEAIGEVAASSTSGTIGLTNDNMEHGSSGGPWITTWNEAQRTHANGLQSFHIKDGDSTEYGPYFTQDVKGLYDWSSNPANRH